MKKWKIWQIVLFVLFCIALNYCGRRLTGQFSIPFWLDSFGTVLCAYLLGPFPGAVVGLTANLMYGVNTEVSIVYGVISIALAVIVGIAARKNTLRTFFGTMTVGMLSALVSVAIAVPINYMYNNSATGNAWGDGVYHLLLEIGIPNVLSMVIAEFYIDFTDKLLTLFVLFTVLRQIDAVRKKARKKAEKAKLEENGGSVADGAVMMLLIFAAAGSLLLPHASVSANDTAASAISYNDYVQSVYNSSNGLPCGEANDIAETTDGILWIGTYAGLYRFNGTEFRWMDGYESVRNVNCLHVDKEGRLWIGTNDNGLSIAINEKIVNVLDEPKGLPSNSVRCITESSDGYYYIGTTGSMQILTLNGGMRRVNTLSEISYADKCEADNSGHVAVVTQSGKLFLLGEGQVLSSIQLEDDSELFNCCVFGSDRRLYVGTTLNRIFCFDISNDYFEEASVVTCEGMSSINDLFFMGNGDLIISADTGVGYIDSEGHFKAINVNSFNNSIDNILLDYQENLWFTSSRLGLLRLSQSSFRDVYSTVGMPQRVVNSITKWQGNIYVGTDKGLDVVDPTCHFQVNNELTDAFKDIRIRCILTDSTGHLWICTYGKGLFEILPNRKQYVYNSDNGSFGSRARLVKELSDGTIAAAGDTGISFIHNHEIVKTIGLTKGFIGSMILTITELPDGRILAGTDGDGIAVISEDYEVQYMITRENGLSSAVVLRTVYDQKSDGVFIVTSNGLCYMDKDGAIRPLSNFPYFNNYDVWMKDNETLFVTGSSGIYVVNRTELLSGIDNISYDLLDVRKGLTSALTANSWNYDDGDGNLYLSTDKGLFIADTDRYRADTRSYRMAISKYVLDGTSYRMRGGASIEVGRGINRVELYPEIINYTIQDPYVGYYLEGFEKSWTILPQSAVSSIIYTNLPNGEFNFHLAVFDSNKKRILEERTYVLVKEKEMYDNTYFRLYMLVVGALAVVWLTWFLVFRQVRKQMEFQQKELDIAHKQVQMGNETIMAIAKAVDAKDERTSQHSARVSMYSVMIGEELGLSKTELEALRRTARMHDIGKIGIPDAILKKPGRLTDEEYAIMKSHTTRGGEILKDFTLIDHVIEGTLYHHERYDGRGYPNGLKGEDIPLFARIIGVADAFDAMTANRVYRRQMDFGYVLNEMKKGRGTQFDPQMDDILLRLVDEGKINLEELYPVHLAGETAKDDNEARAVAEKEAADAAAAKEAERAKAAAEKEAAAAKAAAEKEAEAAKAAVEKEAEAAKAAEKEQAEKKPEEKSVEVKASDEKAPEAGTDGGKTDGHAAGKEAEA